MADAEEGRSTSCRSDLKNVRTPPRRDQLGGFSPAQTARFLLASRKLAPCGRSGCRDAASAGRSTSRIRKKDHPFLKRWFELADRKAPDDDFASAAARVPGEGRRRQRREEPGRREEQDQARAEPRSRERHEPGRSLLARPIDKYNFWRDLFERSQKDAGGALQTPDGVYYYGKGKIDRFLQRRMEATTWNRCSAELARLEEGAAAASIRSCRRSRTAQKPRDIRVAIRGDATIAGDVAPRRFLSILCERRAASHSRTAAAGWNWPRRLPIRAIRSPRA